MSNQQITIVSDGDLVNLDVHFNFYPGSPDIIGGEPDRCAEGEASDYEIISVFVDGIIEIHPSEQQEYEIVQELERTRECH